MIRRLLIILAALLMSTIAAAQVQQSNFAWGLGPGNIPIVVPGATVTVCAGTTLPIPGAICSPTTPIYTSAALTTTAANPITADAGGNYSFWGVSGNSYVISVSANGFSTYSYSWTAPGSPTNVIFAANYPGADICAKIANAAVALYTLSTAGGTINAQSFVGSQPPCANSMFASWPTGSSSFIVTVQFGPVNILVNGSQVIPTHTTLQGVLFYGLTTPFVIGGTSIQAATTFPINTPVLVMGNGVISQDVKVMGMRVSCVSPATGTPTAISGCTPIQNHWSQEGSFFQNVGLDGGNPLGFDVSTPQAMNSGPYTNVTISMNGVNSAAAQCFKIGDASSLLILGGSFSNISCGGGANQTEPTTLGTIDASAVAINNSHFEQGTTALLIGSLRNAHAIKLSNNTLSGTAGNPMTNGVVNSSSFGADGLNIETLYSLTGQNVTNLLVDQLTNGGTITVASQNAIGGYIRDVGNQVISSSAQIPTSLLQLRLNATTVSALPAAASFPGMMMSVSDSTTVTVEGQTCVGSSSNKALAFSNGTVWKCF